MISLNWCKDYIDIENEDLHELAVKITKAGVNVEKVIDSRVENLVIGEVKECIDHPDSDHLHVCQVDIGEKTVQIVCGAPNVRKGLKVLVALPGCVLPEGTIEAGKIRGVESNGMICALFELGLEEKNDETYAKGITELDTDLPNGTDANILLGTDDTVYELDVHKHRNNDCYYHVGFAYEIASILSKKVKLPDESYKEDKDSIDKHVSLKVDTEMCPYYTAKMVKGVVIKESPDFIKKRLIAAGMRPINNVVDISNYVMLEYGNPLHFFDAKKLGNKIVVRQATKDEPITTLDNQDRVLSEKDIVITDGKKPVCIAGVMGGLNTDVDETTKDIVIEAAIFDAVSIRYTAARLDLKSEASIRYGKGLNYEYTNAAMDRCLSLLQEYADATILDGEVLFDNVDKTEKIVEFTSDEINKYLGIKISDDDMEVELKKLDFKYTLKDHKFICTIPRRRLDIDPNVADMAEEIGRLYGYHNLVSTLPEVSMKKGVYKGDVGIRKQCTKRLRSLGLNEVKTYTLTSPKMASMFKYEERENITLPSPMSQDKSVIRTSIIPSLLNVYEYNKARKVEDINIYEIAKTYDKEYTEDHKIAILMHGKYIINKVNNVDVKVDFYLLKGIIENLLKYLGFKNRYDFQKVEVKELHPGVSASIMIDRKPVGIIGRVHPSMMKDAVIVAELSMTALYNLTTKPLKFKEASKYPEIKKDVAFVVPNELTNAEIEAVIKHAGGRLLDNIDIFDIYRDIEPGKKSMAYNLTFKDDTRTLSDEEVMQVFNNIIKEVESKLDVKLRG
jgi:phenylalanyl-tRNA synthetase beta chain